jgi:hypothetical protein
MEMRFDMADHFYESVDRFRTRDVRVEMEPVRELRVIWISYLLKGG